METIEEYRQALEEARPVMEWTAEQPCLKWEGVWTGKAVSYCLQFDFATWDTCPPCQARAWVKKYFPGEKP